MKFADWLSGSNTIFAGGNMRFYSAQSTNAANEASALPITAANTYSDIMDLNPNVDLNSTFGGRQIEIIVEAKIPSNSVGGSYSTSYDINTTATSTITLSGLTQTYNGTPRPVSTTTDPIGLSTTVTYTGISGTTYGPSTTAPTHAGTYTAYGEVTDPGYTATTSETLTISRAPISVVADLQTKVYRASDPVLTYKVIPSNAPYGDDTFSGALSRDSGENAGQYNINQGNLALDSDYVLTYSSNNFTITQAGPLTISGLTADSRPYDGTTVATISGTPVLSDAIAGDDVAVTGTPVGAFADKNVGTAKLVTVSGLSLSGTTATNYTLTQPTGLTGDITALPITVTAQPNTKLYDTNTSAAAIPEIVPPIVAGDTAKFIETYDNANVAGSPNKILTPSGPIVDSISQVDDSTNYAITYTNDTTGVINPAPVTVSATGHDKTYDGTTNATVDLVVNGAISPDAVTATGIANFDNKDVGNNKTITVTDIILGGTDAGNYTLGDITTANTRANITLAPLTITAKNLAKTYGTELVLGATTTGFTVSGLLDSDSVSSVTLTSDGSASTALVSGSPYLIVPSDAQGSGLDNYTIPYDYENGSLSVNKASQDISFPTISDMTYGDADFTVSATGGSSGNSVTFSTPSTGICSVTGDTVHIIAGGNCTVVASQAGNDNYEAATDVSQTFHITAANLVLTVPTTDTIAQSASLISETNGKANNNADLDSLVTGGLLPIQVRLQNIGDAASANVRINSIGANNRIQFWAKDTSGNWYDINVTGWGPTGGFPVPAGYDVSTNIYVISDTAGSYPLVVNLVDAVTPTTILATNSGTVIVEDRTPPTLNIVGFTENSNPMSGDMTNGYTLNTDNNPNTHYTIQFTSGSAASEALKVENVALTLVPTNGQTADLQTFYSTNYPPEYQTYLDAAAAGTQPFAYIKADGTTAIKLLDGAQYTLALHESDMIVPGNYPLGTYTVTGTIHDIAGNSTVVTFKLIVAGDRIAPVGGQLTMVTKLHPAGITILTPTDNVYALPPLSLDGADVFQSMSVVVTDETELNTASVPVYIDGNTTANGEMVYDSGANIWNYMNQTSRPDFSSGTHSLVATFSDIAGNKTTLIATFTTDNTPPTATVVQSGTVTGGTITYTFSEPVQLTSNDSVTIYPVSEIASKLAVYAVIGSDYTTASQVAGVTITDAAVSGNVWTLTYTGNLVNQVNTKYIVDAWGYKITDLAGNQMLPAESEMFTVISDNQKITYTSNAGGSISAVVPSGSNPKYEIDADSGNYISDVLVDGVSVINPLGAGFVWITGDTIASYTFANVIAPHTLSAVFALIPPLASNPITGSASDITSSDATLNGTNGPSDATGHSFWVSTATFSTASPTLPADVYSTPDLGAITAGHTFSAQLSSVSGLPTVMPNTPYYFVAWSNVGGVWYPGAIQTFTTKNADVVYNNPHVGPPYLPLTGTPLTITLDTSGEVATGTRSLPIGGDILNVRYSQSTLS